MGDPTFSELARDPFVQTGVLAVVGALVTRILLRRYPAQRLVFQLAFFAALTWLLYRHGIGGTATQLVPPAPAGTVRGLAVADAGRVVDGGADRRARHPIRWLRRVPLRN